MGINTNLVVSEFSAFIPNFTCSICNDFWEDVVTIRECEHNFCRLCIEEWIRQSDDTSLPCPECRGIFTPATDFTQPSRHMRTMLSSFKFHCSNEPCEETVTYDRFNLHKEECWYEIIKCTFCTEGMERQNLTTHKLGCITYVKYEKSELEIKNGSLIVENTLLKDENNLLKTENSALQIEKSSLTKFVNEVNSVNIKKTSLQKEIDFLKTKNFSLQTTNTSLCTNNSSLIKEVKGLKMELEKE